MSYLHCPVCSRAFNLAVQPSCPYCPAVAILVDPIDDVVAAVESLARALAHASPAQRAEAAARIKLFAVPTPDALPGAFHDAARSTHVALTPTPAPPTPRRMLATLALTVLDRIAPHAPRRLFRAVHARVKALAA